MAHFTNGEINIVDYKQTTNTNTVTSTITTSYSSRRKRGYNTRSTTINANGNTMKPIKLKEVNWNDTIQIIKLKIFSETDIMPLQQKLYFKEEILNDDKTIISYNIVSGDTLLLQKIDEKDLTDESLLIYEDQPMQTEEGFKGNPF